MKLSYTHMFGYSWHVKWITVNSRDRNIRKICSKKGSPAFPSRIIGSAIVRAEPRKAKQKRIEKIIFCIPAKAGAYFFRLSRPLRGDFVFSPFSGERIISSQKNIRSPTGAFFAEISRASSGRSNKSGYSIHLKVHKRENFLGSDIEICTFS